MRETDITFPFARPGLEIRGVRHSTGHAKFRAYKRYGLASYVLRSNENVIVVFDVLQPQVQQFIDADSRTHNTYW